MHSGCLLRSRKDLSGEIKLLQKPESLWLEQLILPSSDTSLLFLCHRIWESHRCSLHSGPEVLLLLHLWVGGGFQSGVVIGFGWGVELGAVFSVLYFQCIFTALVRCWVLYSSAFRQIKTDCKECSGHFDHPCHPLNFIDADYCILILKSMYHVLTQTTSSFSLLNLCIFSIVYYRYCWVSTNTLRGDTD